MKIHSVLLILFTLPFSTFAGNPALRVAVFDDEGVGASSKPLIASLNEAKAPIIQVTRITSKEMLAGGLAEFDVLVHPGGSGSKQGKALGEEGREAVRAYIRKGGGFLGVCAGAYLATNDYAWSLNLIDAKVVDRRHWARGKGSVQLQLSPEGQALFKHDSPEMMIQYEQGPLLARKEWDDPEVPDYESLAIFASEVAENGAPKGVMAGTSAAVRCEYGSGRVVCFSPHPELTDGLHHLIPLVVNWAAGMNEAATGGDR